MSARSPNFLSVQSNLILFANPCICCWRTPVYDDWLSISVNWSTLNLLFYIFLSATRVSTSDCEIHFLLAKIQIFLCNPQSFGCNKFSIRSVKSHVSTFRCFTVPKFTWLYQNFFIDAAINLQLYAIVVSMLKYLKTSFAQYPVRPCVWWLNPQNRGKTAENQPKKNHAMPEPSWTANSLLDSPYPPKKPWRRCVSTFPRSDGKRSQDPFPWSRRDHSMHPLAGPCV